MNLIQKITDNVYRVLNSTYEKQITEVFNEISKLMQRDYSMVHIRSREEMNDKAINGNSKFIEGLSLDFRGASYLVVKPVAINP